MGTRNLNQLYDECKAELKSIGIEPNPIKEVRVNPRWAFTRACFLLHPSLLDDLITIKSYTVSTSV